MRFAFAAALAVLLGSVTAEAQSRAPKTSALQIRASLTGLRVLDNVALNATAADRTVTVRSSQSWAKALVFVDLTRAAATSLDATFLCSPDGTTFFKRQSQAISGGTSTLSDFTYTKAVTGSEAIYIESDVRGCQEWRMVFSGTSAGGSDLVDVYVTLVTGE
ncbi:MAG: hypothetical protein AAF654_14805 [Myxococcota bacterium]